VTPAGQAVADSPISVLCTVCGGPVAMPARARVAPLACPSCGKQYGWRDGILMLGEPRDPDSYPEDLHALLAAVEPRHFWFHQRNRLIVSTLREVVGDLTGRDVLDVGCGTGFVLAALEAAGCLGWGLDMNEVGLRHARKRVTGPLICEDAARVPFAGQFRTALLCDVLEHVSDDRAVLLETRQALRPDGVLLVTVPAHRWLWTPLDDASGHRRRYTRRSLVQALRGAGFSPVLVRYFNSLLVPIQLLQRRLLGDRPAASEDERLDLIRRALRVNHLLGAAMSADLVLSRLPWTFGSSIVAVVRPA
jgi:SAM-dependent methyltransferase